MAVIYQDKNFKLESVEKPFLDRLEGAHIQISLKNDDTKLTPELLGELEKFIDLATEAVKAGRKKRGLDIGRIDYQDDNDKPSKLPVQIYFREISSIKQKYSEPVNEKHEKDYEPLNEEDVRTIEKEIKKTLKKRKDAQDIKDRAALFQNKFSNDNFGSYKAPPARKEHRQRA